MDKRAADFAAQLMEAFKIEAQEHLQNLTDGLLALEKGVPDPERKEIIETIFREAHSLKGAARAVSQIAIQDICQGLENILSDLKNGKIEPTQELIDSLYPVIDKIGKHLNHSESVESIDKESEKKIENNFKIEDPPKNAQEPIKNLVNVSEKGQADSAPTHNTELHETSQNTTIRVSIDKLDGLMQAVEEMLIVKIITGERFSQLKQLSGLITAWEKNWNKYQNDFIDLKRAQEGVISHNVPSKDFLGFIEQNSQKIKETKISMQSMVKTAAQDLRLAGSMVDSLLEDTKKALMQPFRSLFDIIPKMVRDIAYSLGKKINLEIAGGDIDVDRRILEEMKDPLIHLIRNSIDHGVEPADERVKFDKPSQGQIKLSATQISGNQVEITIADDGRGINSEGIKKTAIKSGTITEKEASVLSEQEAILLIFKSGLSTSPIITEFSGRGLGLGIVLEKVEKLGGQLKVETVKDKGTTFKITLPLTLATFRGVHILAAGQDFIFPIHNLSRVVRLSKDEIRTAEGKETINLNGKILSYIHLAQLLQIPLKQEVDSKYVYVLIVKSMEVTVAIGVDSIQNELQVFVKGLGKQLHRVRNIAAATIMEWGKVVPILDPFDLIKGFGKQIAKTITRPAVKDDKERKRSVLIAEDSLTARMLLKNILESSGFHVITAVDGAEALTIAKTETVELLLSDIEMPRMNGLQLTENIRRMEKYKDLPIILCTSRGSREDREKGIEVGANAYIDKSTFTQSHLLEIIKNFL